MIIIEQIDREQAKVQKRADLRKAKKVIKTGVGCAQPCILAALRRTVKVMPEVLLGGRGGRVHDDDYEECFQEGAELENQYWEWVEELISRAATQ